VGWKGGGGAAPEPSDLDDELKSTTMPTENAHHTCFDLPLTETCCESGANTEQHGHAMTRNWAAH